MYDATYSKSKDQPGKVANPARGQLNRENEYHEVVNTIRGNLTRCCFDVDCVVVILYTVYTILYSSRTALGATSSCRRTASPLLLTC